MVEGFALKCNKCSKEWSFKELFRRDCRYGVNDFNLDINHDGAIQTIECDCGNKIELM